MTFGAIAGQDVVNAEVGIVNCRAASLTRAAAAAAEAE